MVDIESSVFSPIAAAFTEAYPQGSRYSEPTETPANFPTLVLYESDSSYSGYPGLDAKKTVIDVDVYSNLVSGAKQECKAIMALVESEMMRLGKWELVFSNQIKNADQRIFRIKARFRGVVVQETEQDGIITVRVYRK